MFKVKLTIVALAVSISMAQSLDFQLELDPSKENALPAAILKAADEAYETNMRGLDALDKKDYPSALKHFDEALEIFPQYSDALNNRGVVLFRRGDVMGATRTWEEVVKRDSEYSVGFYNLGLVHLYDKNYKDAQKMFEAAIKVNKKFPEAITRLGIVYLLTNNRAAALDNFERAYKVAPTHQDAWSFYSYGLLLSGDTVKAVTVLKAAGDKMEALCQLGRIEGIRKNYKSAGEYLSRAIDLGADPSVLVELASVQMDGGDNGAALSTLDRYFSKEIRPSSDAWLLAGLAAKESKGVPKALEYYERGLRQYPRDPLLRYNAGQIYFMQKKLDRAEGMWEGLADSLQEPSLFYMRALAARQRKDLASAEKYILKALSMDDKAEYHDFLGVIHHTRGAHDKAEEEFRKALKINPNLKSAQLNLAMKSKSSVDLDAAVSQLSKQLELCKGDSCADLAVQVSVLHYYRKDYAKAVALLSTVKNKDEKIYHHLVLFHKELQEYEKAITVLEEARAKLVLEPGMEYELSELYLIAGKTDKAVKSFQDLIPKWKENPWRLYYQLGYALMEQNDLQSAKMYFEKSLSAKKDNPAARGLLAFVLNRTGNVEQARVHWEKNIKDDPQNPVLHINMGLSHEREGRYEQALEYYKKALALKPDDKSININIGNAYVGLDRTAEAMNAFKAALETDKRDLAAYNLFLLAKKKNDKSKATEMSGILKKEFPTSIHTRRVSAEMAFWNGDTLGAQKSLEALDEKDAYDWYALGRIYAAKGQREEAQKALAKLPSEALWDKEKKAVLATLAFQSGNYDEAFSLYKESGDTSSAAAYNMVLTAYNAKRYSDALAMCGKVIKKVVGKDRADLCRIGGNCAFALKNWKEAKSWYLQLSAVEARNAVVQYNLAVAHYNLGEVEDSYSRYQNARELDKTIHNKDIELRYEQLKKGAAPAVVSVPKLDSLDQWYNQAVDYQTSGKETLAEAMYRKIVARNPEHNQAWNNLGALYGARGELDSAVVAYRKALEKKHDIPETYANLVNVYLALEDLKSARLWLTKGLGHNPGSEVLEQMKGRIDQAEKSAKK